MNYFLVRIFAAAGLVLSVAPTESLRLLLGEEWVDAAPVLRILGFYVAAATLLQNMQILLYARGAMFGSIRMRAIQLGVLLPGVLGAGWLGSLEGVALSLLASTLLATGVGWAMSRDVVRGSGTGIFAAPGVVLLATAAVFWALRPLTAALPFWSVPFLPPLVFAALLALVERRRLLEQVGVLRSQFGRTGA